MPHDQPEATATVTTRRAFLARTAAGGAVVATGTVVGPLGRLLPAGAQESDKAAGALTGEAFAAFAAPLELGAVQAYQAALENDALSPEWQDNARTFQGHHQAVATTLTSLLPTDADKLAELLGGASAPAADPEILSGTAATVAKATAEEPILTALASLEETLAATHLAALAGLDDPSLARTVSQVLAVESQQAVALGRAAGAELTSLTPAEASTDGARTPDTSN